MKFDTAYLNAGFGLSEGNRTPINSLGVSGTIHCTTESKYCCESIRKLYARRTSFPPIIQRWCVLYYSSRFKR